MKIFDSERNLLQKLLMNKQCKGSAQWARKCYGVDSQAGKLVIVRAERAPWRTWALAGGDRGRVNYVTVASDDPSFAEEIRNGAVSVASLTVRESFTNWLEAPFSALKKAQKVFPTLLDIQLPFALENCVYCFLNVSRTRKNAISALAVAARLGDVEKKIESMKALGIDPLVLDHEGLALWTQSLRELPVRADHRDLLRVVVCMGGGDHSTLVIGRGEKFLGAHSIRHDDTSQVNRILKSYQGSGFRGQMSEVRCQGEQQTTDNGQRTTAGADHKSQIANPAQRDKSQTCPAMAGSQIIWLWTGPGAVDSGLVDRLRDQLSTDWSGTSFAHDEPDTFLARALATRALLPGPLRCNLRTGLLTHPAIIQRSRRESIKTALLFALVGLLLCGMNIIWGKLVRRKEVRIDHAFTVLADDLAGYHLNAKGEHALKIVRDKLDRRMELLRSFQDAFEPSLASTLDAIVEIAGKYDLRYEMLTLSRDKVEITGTGGDWNKCEELLRYLVQEGFAFKMDRKDARADGRIPFTITSGGRK